MRRSLNIVPNCRTVEKTGTEGDHEVVSSLRREKQKIESLVVRRRLTIAVVVVSLQGNAMAMQCVRRKRLHKELSREDFQIENACTKGRHIT
jgi:hypothetical protein